MPGKKITPFAGLPGPLAAKLKGAGYDSGAELQHVEDSVLLTIKQIGVDQIQKIRLKYPYLGDVSSLPPAGGEVPAQAVKPKPDDPPPIAMPGDIVRYKPLTGPMLSGRVCHATSDGRVTLEVFAEGGGRMRVENVPFDPVAADAQTWSMPS